MPNVRNSKQHIYNAVSGEGSYVFDALSVINDSIYTLGAAGATTNFIQAIPASASGTSVLLALPIPCDCVIVRCMWGAQAVTSSATSDNQINFQVGPPTANQAGANSAPFAGTTGGAAVGAAQTTTAIGKFLFAKAQNVYSVAGGSTIPIAQTATPDIVEAFYTTGQTILVQINTGSGGGVTFPLFAAIVVAPVDRQPTVSTANPKTDF